MPNRYTLFLSQTMFRAMLDHTRTESPRECCGLLAGTLFGLVAQAVRLLPLVNSAERPEIEYLSEPRSMFAAVKTMRAAKLDIVAIYHSHPTSEPIPSRKDCARSFSDSVMNLIFSTHAGQAKLRGWWLSATGFEDGGVGICEI